MKRPLRCAFVRRVALYAAVLAFVPYWPQPVWHLGPVVVQAWDIFVALGFLSGTWTAVRLVERDGRDPDVLLGYAPWALLVGFVFAHLVHVTLYEPERLARDPWWILQFWNGVSSHGGFLGAAISLPIYFRLRRARVWDYADAMAVGVAVGWGVARIGCFLAHDHMGRLTDFPLAVAFPGGPRHDLGLEEALLTLPLAAVAWRLYLRRPPPGTVTAVVVGIYAVYRFFLEFLRATDLPRSDRRYAGLTPAQYGCFLLVAFALYAAMRARRARPEGTGAPT